MRPKVIPVVLNSLHQENFNLSTDLPNFALGEAILEKYNECLTGQQVSELDQISMTCR